MTPVVPGGVRLGHNMNTFSVYHWCSRSENNWETFKMKVSYPPACGQEQNVYEGRKGKGTLLYVISQYIENSSPNISLGASPALNCFPSYQEHGLLFFYDRQMDKAIPVSPSNSVGTIIFIFNSNHHLAVLCNVLWPWSIATRSFEYDFVNLVRDVSCSLGHILSHLLCCICLCKYILISRYKCIV